ncbi:MAG: hypothetical protein DMD71_09755 [Gemmatimonadetes bacterium]|nr:MAG: hypothetical protein DMD71_09755 [Gemmatimonadota bacterium]
MTARERGRVLAAAALTLLLAWLVLYPILLVGVDAAHGDAIAAFARRPGEWQALWASVWISLASVALAAAIGIPLAFLFEWLEFPGRKTLGSLIALPAVLPPFVGVIAFLFLYGESGFVARAVQQLLGLAEPPWRLQGAGAILLVHAYSMYVYFYLFTRAGLAKLDASMLAPAQALGAANGQVLVVRPERLRFGAKGLGGVVRERRYTGAAAFFQVETEGGERLEVLAAPDAARVGERVHLEAVKVLPFAEPR